MDSDIVTSGLTINTSAGTISGLPASTGVYEVLAYINKSNATHKTKTLTTRTIGVAGGQSQIKLGRADIC